jgi:enterochelin esterase-like enzyme
LAIFGIAWQSRAAHNRPKPPANNLFSRAYGLGHLDTFAWVAGFSAAPNTRSAASLLSQASASQARLQLLYLSCGKRDNLIGISQDFHRALRQDKVPHVWHVDDYGHDRESWAESLYHFTQLIFRQRPD